MPGIEYDVSFRTHLAKRRIQEHVNMVELQATDPGKTARISLNECVACYYQTRIAGQAFTDFVCEMCTVVNTHHNTAVPRMCDSCASKRSLCRRCGADRELNEARKELIQTKHMPYITEN
jgi:hypothetical protein